MAKMTARCTQYMRAVKIVCRRKISRRLRKNLHITNLSLFGGEIMWLWHIIVTWTLQTDRQTDTTPPRRIFSPNLQSKLMNKNVTYMSYSLQCIDGLYGENLAEFWLWGPEVLPDLGQLSARGADVWLQGGLPLWGCLHVWSTTFGRLLACPAYTVVREMLYVTNVLLQFQNLVFCRF